MNRLKDKIAIVTGAGQGIGKGIAMALAKEGAVVVIAEIDPLTGTQTAEDIWKIGGQSLVSQCDVRRRPDVEAAVTAAVEKFGTVDILVNNAQTERFGRVEEITDEDMNLILGSGLFGTLYFMQACFPYMKEHGGKIINIGSGGATMGMETVGAYAAAKEGIRGLTKTAAREWGRYRINVNVICPNVMSPMKQTWWNTLSAQEREAEMRLNPMRREGDAEKDIGRVVVFLASSDSDYITGRTLHVDGGRSFYDM